MQGLACALKSVGTALGSSSIHGYDRLLYVDKQDMKMKEDCSGCRQDISCLAFHAPSTVASGDVSGVTLVWDLRNGELRYRFTNPSSPEESGASTPAVNQLQFVDPPGCFPGTLLLTASGEAALKGVLPIPRCQ